MPRRKRTTPTASASSQQAAASKKKRSAKSSPQLSSAPEPSTSQLLTIPYTLNLQTLFLADDNLTPSWYPIQSKQKGAVSLQKCFIPFQDNIHSYFVSTAAAKYAATTVGSISIYRHIGHVSLRKFQQLDNLPPQRQWFPGVKKATKSYVNLRIPLQACWCENEHLALALESLSSVTEVPWPKPYIVALAKREDLLRACDVDSFDEDYDLEVQIYAGRLLFELIACPDIHTLFAYLKSPIKFSPVPSDEQYPAVFPKSPISPRSLNRSSVYNLLRNAESTGYANLTDEQSAKIAKGMTVTLYDYQQQTVRWMIDKENGPYTLNDYFWEERSFTGTSVGVDGGKYYYFPMTGEVRLCKPPITRGGMVTEEMGLGKTVEALALITAQKSEEHKPTDLIVHCKKHPRDVSVSDRKIRVTRTRFSNSERSGASVPPLFMHGDEVLEDPDEIEFPADVKIRRWPAKTTLIVCPKSLMEQWKQEIQNRAPSLTWIEWGPPFDDDHSKHTVGEHAKDIVLTTYEMVRVDSELSKISWKRLILDEAQVTRRSSTQVAKDVFNLRSDYRFLMTGTPLVNSIADLKGQLSFLKLWPFTLESDGFWEAHITLRSGRVSGRTLTGPGLLNKLLKVTMMRHSKGQNLNVSLPGLSYETIKVNLTGSYRACYYYVLASCLDELHTMGHRGDTRRLRTLLRLLLALCLSPYSLDFVALDLARRHTWSRRARTISLAAPSIERVTPQEAIKFVAETSRGVIADSERAFAVTERSDGSEHEKFMEMPLSELREHVVSQKLLPASRAARTRRERLAALAAGGVHRLDTDTLKELRQTAIELRIADRSEISKWSRAKSIARLRLHYDMENGIKTLRTVHESGFTAIMKIANRTGNPSCPVCLSECDERVVVTKCGHLYCLDCIILLLENEDAGRRCAICRRELATYLAVEIKRGDDEETEKKMKAGDQVLTLMEKGGDLSKNGALCQLTNRGAAGTGSSSNHAALEESDDQSEMSLMSAEEVWKKFEDCAPPAEAFNAIGRNERFPSLCAEFLRHLAAVRSGSQGSPKLLALLDLIRSSSEDTKFCVVAGSVDSLKGIYQFLKGEGIECVGAGVKYRQGGGSERVSSSQRTINEGVQRFSSDAQVRVFLLNPTNAAGLTLTAANVVVFMETLMRPADEIQAAARVHRIGQKKPVRVVRIVTRNTLEQRIADRRGEVKTQLDEGRALTMAPTSEASDTLILQLFGRGEEESDGDDEEDDGRGQVLVRLPLSEEIHPS